MYGILARLIGSKLERLYGQSFVIENRPGASSITGAVSVARAAPDGYTLMTAASTPWRPTYRCRRISPTIRSPILSRSRAILVGVHSVLRDH
jgi:tripartite-type tricarboxylate transporter receptor subunit TctC